MEESEFIKYVVMISVPKLEDISHVKIAGEDCKIMRFEGEHSDREWLAVPSIYNTPDEFISEGRLMLMFGQRFVFFPGAEFIAWMEDPENNKCPEPISMGTAGFNYKGSKSEEYGNKESDSKDNLS